MDHISIKVKCPFYKEKQGDIQRIKCEGVSKGNTVQLTFSGDKREYIRHYCSNTYECCRIYRMLEEKYIKKAGG
jgi:hypothetical protein